MLKTLLFTLCAAGLLACSAPANRLDMVQLKSELSLTTAFETLMVRTVSLPAYAAAEELAIQSAEGLILSDTDVIWADAPERAVTLRIAQHLNQILSATAGPDPWPFVALPDIAVDIRVSEMLTHADGHFHLQGQYFVGGDGIDYPNSAKSFDIAQAMSGQTLRDVAAAQSAALLTLAEQIARTVAR
jgi:hypothetical protein